MFNDNSNSVFWRISFELITGYRQIFMIFSYGSLYNTAPLGFFVFISTHCTAGQWFDASDMYNCTLKCTSKCTAKCTVKCTAKCTVKCTARYTEKCTTKCTAKCTPKCTAKCTLKCTAKFTGKCTAKFASKCITKCSVKCTVNWTAKCTELLTEKCTELFTAKCTVKCTAKTEYNPVVNNCVYAHCNRVSGQYLKRTIKMIWKKTHKFH